MANIAVILPAYNEELTISETIVDFHRALPDAQIWVVNNASTDKTEQMAKDVFYSIDCKGGVLREDRPGKGNAVRCGFSEVQADIYVLADADMTYPAEQVHQLIEPVVAGRADMVVGDRHSAGHYAAENKRPLHGFGNRLVGALVNRLFKADLHDIMSGYRVFNRSFVKNYPILVAGFEIETDMVLHALDKKFRIVELPINYKDRPEGSVSKLNTLADGIRVLSTIANVLRHYRPLVFFGTAALVFALLGLLAGYPVIDEWVRMKYISHVPLAILATGLAIASIVFGAIGLILDSIAFQGRRSFELHLLSRTNTSTFQQDLD
ncbi:glycosyltransferase family 2 protein [Candidatus Njordibacter sp. Uisw_039]|uniref:glycosyltransferase family 2 protein n=1 Tax=Candidatus Njordibacter sp. Uisw_039 TaxID=3230972 RepID=UPI003D41AEA7